MLGTLWNSLRTAVRFRGYKPQPVTPLLFLRWLYQFPSARERELAIDLLGSVVYLNEQAVQDILVNLNGGLLRGLDADGIPATNVIYIQIDDAGSSSPVVLNLLRNQAGLERRGCKLADSHHILKLRELTYEIGEGAIIYVDDFIGTGDQFEANRKFVGEHIVGNFSEFLLAPVICEEGVHHLGKIGVEPVTEFVHTKAERPLVGFSNKLNTDDRSELLRMTKSFDDKCYYDGLGYKRRATMYVLYSNAPDTTPKIFRGSPDQKPRCGIFPRFSDLPLPN